MKEEIKVSSNEFIRGIIETQLPCNAKRMSTTRHAFSPGRMGEGAGEDHGALRQGNAGKEEAAGRGQSVDHSAPTGARRSGEEHDSPEGQKERVALQKAARTREVLRMSQISNSNERLSE